MFGVIICPKCHRARGVSLSTKSAKCPHCGHSIDVSLARVYHKTDSQEELVLAVQKMTERLAVDIEEYPAVRKGRPSKHSQPKAKRSLSSEDDLRLLVIELARDTGEFSNEDVKSKTGLGDEEAEKLLHRLMQAGLAYEPTTGVFKLLPP